MPETIDPFAQPCDLWVLPPPRASAWFSVIDWYLNWQMSKGLAYPGLHLPNEVLRLSEEYEVPLPALKQTDASAPLLVLNHNRLPTAKCVVIESQPIEPWLKAAYAVALNLGADHLHVFLPSKTAATQAAEIWDRNFAGVRATFSEDTGQSV